MLYARLRQPSKLSAPIRLRTVCTVSSLIATVITLSGPAAWSATDDSHSPQFTASPVAGPAPLTVKFCASAGIAIDFGDGTSSGMGPAQRGDCPPGLASSASHTYTRPGSYRLRGSPCPSSMLHPECGEAAAQAGAITIVVTGASQ